MARSGEISSRIEASLLEPRITPGDARRAVDRWVARGISRVIVFPALLAELDPPGRREVHFVGACAHPHGASTLASKRMEILECARLGARSACVPLTPFLLAGGSAEPLEQEMAALLGTWKELEVYFLVDWSRLPEDGRTLLLRLLRSVRPAALASPGAGGGAATEAESLAEIRGRLHRKVSLVSWSPCLTRADALARLDAGAARVASPSPEDLLEAPA